MPNLEITTIIGCSNMCSYCPQDALLAAYPKKGKLMKFTDFVKLIDNVPIEVDIFFAGYSEPFLNKESSLMMKYAIERGHRTVLYTTTIGFNQNDIEVLKDVVFDVVSIHYYDGRKDNFQEGVDKFKAAIKSKVWSQELIENPLSRAGNNWDVKPKEGKLKCSIAPNYDHNVVLPNGNVYLCCMDYSLTHCVGNLNETKFIDLDRSMNMDADHICRKCSLSVEA
jgi:hypothetical protein